MNILFMLVPVGVWSDTKVLARLVAEITGLNPVHIVSEMTVYTHSFW